MASLNYQDIHVQNPGTFAVRVQGEGSTPVHLTGLSREQADFWFNASKPGGGYVAQMYDGQRKIQERH